MTATDELRAMLDERGVEWQKPKDIMSRIKTVWRDGPWEYTAIETSGGEFSVYVEHRYWLTPAQAIEATLGRGECSYEIAAFGDGKAWYQCSECGGMASADYDPPKYCPHCGAKVVSE